MNMDMNIDSSFAPQIDPAQADVDQAAFEFVRNLVDDLLAAPLCENIKRPSVLYTDSRCVRNLVKLVNGVGLDIQQIIFP